MKNVLVTGGAGFIGSNFIQYILDDQQDIILLVTVCRRTRILEKSIRVLK